MSQSTMPNVTRLNVQCNRDRNFIIRQIEYIELEKDITNEILSKENI